MLENETTRLALAGELVVILGFLVAWVIAKYKGE